MTKEDLAFAITVTLIFTLPLLNFWIDHEATSKKKEIMYNCIKYHCTLVCEKKYLGEAIQGFVVSNYFVNDDKIIDIDGHKVYDINDCIPLESSHVK
jgi:hypothetical protein